MGWGRGLSYIQVNMAEITSVPVDEDSFTYCSQLIVYLLHPSILPEDGERASHPEFMFLEYRVQLMCRRSNNKRTIIISSSSSNHCYYTLGHRYIFSALRAADVHIVGFTQL
jgi:hypothetical protein